MGDESVKSCIVDRTELGPADALFRQPRQPLGHMTRWTIEAAVKT